MIKELSAEKIVTNLEKFKSYFSEKYLKDRSQPFLGFLDEVEECLAIAPASSRTEYHMAFPGGLVDHSLRVLQNSLILAKAFGYDLKTDSLIVASLLHDIGKIGLPVGDSFQPFYIPQESQWHREKLGQMYVYNDQLHFMTTRDRSLYLVQHYKLPVTMDEWVAIMLNDGYSLEANKPYQLKEPLLATIVMQADYNATLQEKTG